MSGPKGVETTDKTMSSSRGNRGWRLKRRLRCSEPRDREATGPEHTWFWGLIGSGAGVLRLIFAHTHSPSWNWSTFITHAFSISIDINNEEKHLRNPINVPHSNLFRLRSSHNRPPQHWSFIQYTCNKTVSGRCVTGQPVQSLKIKIMRIVSPHHGT